MKTALVESPQLTKKLLLSKDPCADGVRFIKSRSLRTAWKICENSDWMVWALLKLELFDDDTARRFAIACAYHTLHFFEDSHPGDNRPRLALEASERSLTDKSEEATTAWDAARAAESKWQANTLRELINPFSKNGK